jgi:hypothetical protein
MKTAWTFIASLAIALAGCTHVQLRNNAVNESSAVSELVTQQVMDNLAMFVYDPYSMPYFSYPNQGATSVIDQGTAGVTAGWGRPITTGQTSTFSPKHFTDFLLASITGSGSASRQSQEGLTMSPILDPRKLELMRCAYQIALSNCGYFELPRNCPDCKARFNQFYTGDPNTSISDKANGIITSNCLRGPCWFHVCQKKCLPRDCSCNYIGHYCDVYVWVGPEGRDGLTKLTLAILDYAINTAPVRITKDVTYNIDELGLPTSRNDAVGTVKATIAIDEQNVSLLNMKEANESRIEQILLGRRKQLQDQYSADAAQNKGKPDTQEMKEYITEIALIDAKLQFLQEQLRAGALKEQFVPGGTSPTPSGLLQLQLYQNTLTPLPQAPISPP